MKWLPLDIPNPFDKMLLFDFLLTCNKKDINLINKYFKLFKFFKRVVVDRNFQYTQIEKDS